jgi:3',5'-nucleoside bisphosphate phosphatase
MMKKLLKIKFIPLITVFFFLSNNTFGQPGKVIIPDIPGFYTLKCDLHMHSVYSDGQVWPTLRVTEAIRDGLDAISITDHIDFQAFPEIIKKDYNKPYEIAKKFSEGKDLIIINGGEISPRVPPYHNNAIFLKDVNKLPTDYMKETAKKFIMKDNIDRKDLMAPFVEAGKQGAFVFYNHPGYSWWDKKDTAIFTSFHEELFQKGILNGVEVVNSGTYNIIAHRIAEKYNLTMLGNSDDHVDIFHRYTESHRPMTLVFAKEKSESGIKEALFARRTAVYVDKYIIAREKEAEALLIASLDLSFIKKHRNGEPIIISSITNKSDFTFDIRVRSDYNIERYPLGLITLKPHETTTFIIKELWRYPSELTLRVDVYNMITTPDKHLETEFLLHHNTDSTYIYKPGITGFKK